MILRRRTRPGGWALIECLVLISVLTVILGLCAGTIRLLMKLDRSGRAARDQATDLRRLSEDFRADVHAAIMVLPQPNGEPRLTLALTGSRISDYHALPGSIVRTVREGERIKRVETYRRPARTTLRFEVAAGTPRSVATLVIDPVAGAEGDWLHRDWRVEADLGKDLRFPSRPE